MTKTLRMTKTLLLNRLQVFKSGRAVFDQPFNAGLNILYGDNGSGKSTIAELIFYALGGDLREWKEHAARCDEVVAEIQIGRAVLSIRRPISMYPLQPMMIFFGGLAEASQSASEGWKRFDYKRGDRGQSFTQVLFEALDIPIAPGEGGSIVTMHQMLRVMYSDQMTPIQRLFRAEHHDSWDIRQAVGDLVRGVGGYDLPELRMKLAALDKQFAEINAEYRGLVQVATRYGEDIRPEFLENEIKRQNRDKEKLQSQLDELLNSAPDPKAESKSADSERKKLLDDLADTQKKINARDEQIRTISYEIEDSAEFIQYLKDTLQSFEEAADTYSVLEQIRFEHCPVCFSKLKEKKSPTECHLCGNELPPGEKAAQVLALKLDFEHQIKESEVLQAERKEELERLRNEATSMTRSYRRLSEAFTKFTSSPKSARETAIAELNRKFGYIESTIETLQRRAEISRQIATLSERKEELRTAISKLKELILATEQGQQTRIQISNTAIAEWTLKFLRRDLTKHNDFDRLDTFNFDFGDDWMALNGERNVSKSASGMVILKNSFHLALLMSAMHDNKFNLPHFMLFDNIEDKGMVPERSWNFQNIIAETSAQAEQPHQIIITTTMLSPELEKQSDRYLVGKRKYTKQSKTLSFDQG